MFKEKLQLALAEFWHVAWVLILVIAAISVITGFVKEYIPQEKLQSKLQNKNPIIGSIMGAALGALTPFCSASMVPVARGMIEMSAPFSSVLSFLISAPLSNFVVVGIIFATFGFKVAAIYFAWTFSCAVIAGLTVGRSSVKNHVKDLSLESKNDSGKSKSTKKIKKEKKVSSCGAPSNSSTSCSTEPASSTCSSEPAPSCCPAPSSNGSHKEKIRGAFRFAFALFKQIIPYVIIGAAISGITLAFIPNTFVEKYLGDGAWYSIPFAAVIGVPLYLRIEMAIPILSTLLLKGMSMGPAMALLIGGTGASLPEIAILSSMLKPKALVAFVATVLTIAITGGVLFMFV